MMHSVGRFADHDAGKRVQLIILPRPYLRIDFTAFVFLCGLLPNTHASCRGWRICVKFTFVNIAAVMGGLTMWLDYGFVGF